MSIEERAWVTRLRSADDYNLCALYCDYWEWLNGAHPPTTERVRAKYHGYCDDILQELTRRRVNEQC